jgi:hypothetical protein
MTSLPKKGTWPTKLMMICMSITLVDNSPSYSTFKNWVARFGTGHLSTENEECSRRQIQVTIQSHVPDAKSQIHILSLRLFIQKMHPSSRLIQNFRNNLILYGARLLDPCPTLKLEDHPFPAV